MARRRPNTPQIPEAVREAVERTVQATVGGAKEAQETTNRRASGVRTRAASALDDLAKSAEAGAEVVQKRVREALEDAPRPATHDDVKDILKELRALNRRVAALEERLPQPRAASSKSTSKAASKSTKSASSAKRQPPPKKTS